MSIEEYYNQEEENEDKEEEEESKNENTPPSSRATLPALSKADKDPVQSAQDDQKESTQERPPTPRDAAGSSASAPDPAQRTAQHNDTHTPMQPIPKQIEIASHSQPSTGTPPKIRKRTEYIMRDSRIEIQT